MKKKLVLIITAALVLGVAGRLIYLKKINEPKAKPAHKVLQTKKIDNETANHNVVEPTIKIVNEKKYPYFEEYKNSVMPFINSQYPVGSTVNIELTNVVMNNWHMQIFYNAYGTYPNGVPFKENGLNYSNVVRSNVAIPSVDSYAQTDSAMSFGHYTIPAYTKYLTVLINGQEHVQFLVNGGGVCNQAPTLDSSISFNYTASKEAFSTFNAQNTAPYIYSIIDQTAVGNGNYFNPNAATLKYNLQKTPIEAVNTNVTVPAGTVMYYYPSEFTQPIVTTNKTTTAQATYSLRTAGNYIMYLVNIQGQEGWVKIQTS